MRSSQTFGKRLFFAPLLLLAATVGYGADSSLSGNAKLPPPASIVISLPAQQAAPSLGITVPPGFRISVYVDNIPGARSMCLSPGGVLYVGTAAEGKIYAVVGGNNGDPPRVITVAKDLELPNGVAFAEGALFVTLPNNVSRFDHIEQDLEHAREPYIISADFPFQEVNPLRYMALGPDSKLYVSVGAPCNVCLPNLEIFAAISRFNGDGTGLESYSRGIRNCLGFDWDPISHELWFIDNGPEGMGETIARAELNHAPRKGMDFGFPYCYGDGILDPKFGQGKDCSQLTPPALELAPQARASGMRFYSRLQFPMKYWWGIFIAEHGPDAPIAGRVTFVPMQFGMPQDYEVFAEGGIINGKPWGPVDVQPMPDGSLLVSDDIGGKIYRISYAGE